MSQLSLAKQKRITREKRIGILGGSFNPIHNGHLALGQHFAELLELSNLIFMIAPHPWQKINSIQIAPTKIRLKLLELALQGLSINNTRISIGYDEIKREGPTYTIDTIKNMRQKIGPSVFLSLLVGSDQYYSLPSWYQWENLFDFSHICVASRNLNISSNFSAADRKKINNNKCERLLNLFESPNGKIYFSTDLNYDVSSTNIRAILSREKKTFLYKNKKKSDVDKIDDESQYLVNSLPKPVLDYLIKYNIYQQKNHE